MSFLSAHYFWLLLPLLMLLFSGGVEGARSLIRRHYWLLLSIVMVITALARPVMSQEPVDVEERGSDIIIAVDLSYSMQADDIKPTRLAAAKKLLSELIEDDAKNRYAIMAYTTNAIVLSPLSNDKELLLHLFSGLDQELIMTKGTVLMPALKLARKMSKSPKAIVVLLTDGGDELNYNAEALYAREHDLVVNVVMLATAHGSTLYDRSGNVIKDGAGHIVVSSRNSEIAAVAEGSGGGIVSNLSELQSLLKSQERQEFTTNTKLMQYNELFYYFVALALFFIMLAFTVSSKYFKKWFVALLILVGIQADASMFSTFYLDNAQTLYQEENYLAAAAEYAKVEGKYARYNEATAYYKAGEYEKALEIFSSIRSNDPLFKSKLYYNMGNCYIRLQEFIKAREMFIKSLTLHEDRETKENLAFIMKAEEQEHLLTGQQEGKKRAQDAETENQPESGKKKEGGGSNQQSDADGSKGAGGKKVEGEEQLSFSGGKSRLSSKQYELINQRSVNETKPW